MKGEFVTKIGAVMPVVGDFNGACEVAVGEAGVFVGAATADVGTLVA
jgi:hypothetical protein